jgi:hypothetical protein
MFTRVGAICTLLALASCGGFEDNEKASLKEHQLHQSIQLEDGFRLVVARLAVGGATGDLLDRLLVCSGDSDLCEIVADVDVNDYARPEVSRVDSAYILRLNKSDRIIYFRNYSRVSKALAAGGFLITYR